MLTICLAVSIILALAGEKGEESYVKGSPDETYNLIISEICTKNETIIADNSEKFRDYIEIYNSGKAVNLAGFRLANDKGRSEPLGDLFIGSGEYRVVFISDELTGFALGASGGDSIQLIDPWGNIVAQAITASSLADQVMLYENGVYSLSYEASPGFANDKKGIESFRKGIADNEPKLIISELLIANESVLPDEKGVFSDIIELYNVSGAEIMLGSYCISDSYEQRFRFRLPDVALPADARLVLFCDGENYIGAGGEIHINFAISAGEEIYLSDGMGRYSSLTAEYTDEDISLALNTNGVYENTSSSPGYPNTDEGVAEFMSSRVNDSSALIISEVLLSSAEVPYKGDFFDVVEIMNRSTESVSTSGWYLSDGGDPYVYALPDARLAPGECIVIVCSQQTTNFALSDGEVLRLMSPEFKYAPLVGCAAERGMSMSLLSGGDDSAYSFTVPSPGYANTAEGSKLYLQENMPDGLVISELMTANHSYLRGAYSTTSDWVELYNASEKSIQLSEYFLSDDAADLNKCALPEKELSAGEYCVIFLATDALNLLKGYPVLPFSLSSEGEQLYLSNAEGVTDYVFIPELSTDMSYGRAKSGVEFSVLENVTPGHINGTAAEIAAAPIALTPQGVYDDVEYVDVVLSGEGDIYYTTNCYSPGETAVLYTGPIRLTNTTVIRAECRVDGKKDSEVIDLSYIINEYDELGVVSLVTDPDNLWGHSYGMYITGPNAEPDPPYYGANYWQDWERLATLSFFEDNGDGFYVNCGVKIHGAFSRALAKKSIACAFRDKYGDSELVYPIFGEDSLDSYEAIVLRSAGQDAFSARMRDVVITSIASEHLGLPVQKYRPVVMYLDGQYWGLHYIREKANENFVSGNFNVPVETVSLSHYTGWENSEYQALLSYAMENDLSEQEHYDYIMSQIDVDNYVDYIITQLWIGNMDFGNNKFFKTPDSKWKWILYDTDLAFRELDYDSLAILLNPTATGAQDTNSKTLAVELFDNEQFRDAFIERIAWQMENVWTEDIIISRVNEIEALIGADMVKDCERWDESYKYWQQSVESLRTFAKERSDYVIEYVQRYFNLTDAQMRDYGF